MHIMKKTLEAPMHRSRTILSLLLALLLSLSSCSNQAESTQALAAVRALCADEATLPDGKLYICGEALEDALSLSEEMQAALFGNGSYPAALDEAVVGVSYLSYTHPFEITLFCAKSAHGAKKLAKMLLQRRDALLRHWEHSAYADAVQGATVFIHGKWVLLSVTEDAEATAKRLRRAV